MTFGVWEGGFSERRSVTSVDTKVLDFVKCGEAEVSSEAPGDVSISFLKLNSIRPICS